jgi:hypothetical protein
LKYLSFFHFKTIFVFKRYFIKKIYFAYNTSLKVHGRYIMARTLGKCF